MKTSSPPPRPEPGCLTWAGPTSHCPNHVQVPEPVIFGRYSPDRAIKPGVGQQEDWLIVNLLHEIAVDESLAPEINQFLVDTVGKIFCGLSNFPREPLGRIHRLV